MRNAMMALGALTVLLSAGSAAAGPCADEIKTLQQKAAATDDKNAPGTQAKPTERTPAGGEKLSDAAPKGAEGGGTASASAKVLEAQAHDQRGDEAKCMEALTEAKKLIEG